MSFPHAAKGISKIFISELLTLISGIALAIMILITAANKDVILADKAAGLGTGLVIGFFAAGAVFFISFIIKVIGYFQASRDEEGFTRAIIYAVVSIVLFIIANVLHSQKGDVMQWIYTIVLAAAEITQLMIAISTIGGMVDLSYKCRNEGLARRGNTILKIISAIFTLNIILLIINLLLLIVGTFMDMTPACLIFTPIFLPICNSLGVNTVHFGIFMIFNLCIGTITPPVGTTLFVGVRVGGVKIESVIGYLIPFFVAIFLVLLLVTYIPFFSLWLPSLLGYV